VQAWHHTAPAWYFLSVIAFAWLPFSLALPWLARPWLQAWRERDGRVWLLLAWVLLVLLFFSASPGKRDMYILPALPALALAAAPFMDRLAAGRLRWAVLAFVVIAGTLLLGAGLAALTGEPEFERRLAESRGLEADGTAWLAGYLAGSGAVLLAAAALGRMRSALAACGIGLAAVWLGYGLVVHPVLDDDSSSRAVMRQARALAGPTATIALVAWKEQNLLQATGPVIEFGFSNPPDRQLAAGVDWLVHNPQGRLLVSGTLLRGCTADAQPLHVGTANRRQWWLVATPAAADCLEPGP
jgi:4-amino-4-deoxy-L-arabinose transferase-like glycosyltransferase